jgi:hypothetical protein
MSTLYGVNRTLANTGGPTSMIPRAMQNGSVHCIFDSYEASGTSATDVVHMGAVLPDGAVVIGFILSTDDLGTGNTIDIGDTADDDRYASAINTASAAVSGSGAIIVANSTTTQTTGMGYVVGTASGDNQIMITLNSAACTGTICLTILYAV